MKVTTAWTIYDWANSAFALVITAAIFPAYFLEVTDPIIHIGGLTMSNSSLYAYIIAIAYLIIVILSPILSGFADSANNKKTMMMLFMILGSVSCMFLYLFDGMDHLAIGIVAFVLSYMGFIGSLVFYNAFLVEITTEDKFDDLSAKGFAMGYVGSVLLLIINLCMIQFYDFFGFEQKSSAARFSFLMVGIWWIFFSLVPLKYLPGHLRLNLTRKNITTGFVILKDVFVKLKEEPRIYQFLFSFFPYNAGVITIMLLAASFASKEIGFETSELIILILLLQLLAIAGAFLFSKISYWKGNKFSLMSMLFIWVLICIVGYFVTTKFQFYCLGSAVGLVMGGIQSMSRSTYSKLVAKFDGEHTSFFSMYDVIDKASVLIGTLSFGMIEQLTGSMRNSIIALLLFFILGILLLWRADIGSVGKQEV